MSRVITHQTPSGQTIDLCANHEALAPSQSAVSHGMHHGDCAACAALDGCVDAIRTIRMISPDDAITALYATDERVESLRDEARVAGDLETVEMCRGALKGDATARERCAEVIEEARREHHEARR